MTIKRLKPKFDKRNWHKVHYIRPRVVRIGTNEYLVENDTLMRRLVDGCRWEHKLLEEVRVTGDDND